MDKFFKSNVTIQHYTIILFLSTILHLNTIFGGFVFDDSEAIVKNKDVLPHTPLSDVLFNDFWGTEIALNLSHKSYRPFTILTYRLNVYLADNRLNTFHFHATNILLYTFTTLLLYFCLKQFVSDKCAYNASLLFAVHPVHTEVVASLVGRADLLCSIAFLFSIILYKKMLRCLAKSSKHSSIIVFFYVVNIFVVFCGVLCKETSITAFGMCFILEFLHVLTKNKLQSDVVLRCAGLIAAFIAIMYFRLWIMAFEGPIFTKIDNAAAYSDNLFTKIFSYNYIYFLNVLLLLWPQWLCFDWSMGCIPLIEAPSDIRIIFVLVFWFSVIFTLTILFKQYKNKRLSNELTLGCALLVLPFLPASNLFLKVGFVIAERILFLPSAGFCLLVAHGFQKLLKQKRTGTKTHFYCLLLIFASKTIHRNFEWLSEEALFSSALQVCPLNAKVHYNVAKVAADKHDKLLAVEEYQRALSLNPDYEQAMNNLANILREDKQFDEAERLLRKAVFVRPNFAAAWMNLGIVLATLNQTKEAEECYLKAISYRPKYPDCFYNLGNLYLDLKVTDKALKAWEMAVYYRPTHTAAWSNTLVLLDSLNQFDEVLKRGRNALMYNPKAPALHFSIANTLGKLQEFEKAEKHFLEALNFNPHNALYYSNLGVLYHRWGNADKAREMYKKALLIDPNMRTTEINLRKLLNANQQQSNNSKSNGKNINK